MLNIVTSHGSKALSKAAIVGHQGRDRLESLCDRTALLSNDMKTLITRIFGRVHISRHDLERLPWQRSGGGGSSHGPGRQRDAGWLEASRVSGCRGAGHVEGVLGTRGRRLMTRAACNVGRKLSPPRNFLETFRVPTKGVRAAALSTTLGFRVWGSTGAPRAGPP